MKLLDVTHLKKTYTIGGGFLGLRKKYITAVNDVSFHIRHEETLGLVGESGCGKTTTGRMILRLTEPSDGRIIFGERDVMRLKAEELRAYRKDVQLIFQDSFASLDPRMKCGEIVAEALRVHHLAEREKDAREMAVDILKEVGLSREQYERYPHEFSGGQRQRIGIARAICLKPKLIVCDEPVSALDVSVQAQIINMMKDLQESYKLSFLFISHDLSVVKHISDRVAVMYLGKLMEVADKREFFSSPQHPYSQALISAIPSLSAGLTNRIILQDEAEAQNSSKCGFIGRCWMKSDLCGEGIPPLREVAPGHFVSCHLV